MVTLTESRKRLIKFILIGMLAVLTDLAMYWVFLNILPEHVLPGTMGNEVPAKALSFLSGLMVTYHLNKRWTWRRKDRSNKRFAKFLLTYGVSLVLNVTLNAALLRLLLGHEQFAPLPNKYFIAFVGATGVCATFTFFGQKLWIFREPAVA